MIGLVLAAGSGQRLMPLTRDIPKTLLTVADDRTILDVALGNLAECGLTDVAIVVGHRADAIRDRVAALRRRYGLQLHLIDNDRIDRNNAYSLWLARDHLTDGALLVNGDTVHPVTVEHTLLKAADGSGDVLLAVDDVKQLTDEAMKVRLDGSNRVTRITKRMEIADSDGEYIGAALIPAAAGPDLVACLAETWQSDPTLYYEDGLQLLADRHHTVRAAAIGAVDWVEVDDAADLARAREIACRS